MGLLLAGQVLLVDGTQEGPVHWARGGGILEPCVGSWRWDARGEQGWDLEGCPSAWGPRRNPAAGAGETVQVRNPESKRWRNRDRADSETDVGQGGQDTPARNLTWVCRLWAPRSLTSGGNIPASIPRLGDPKICEGASGVPGPGNQGLCEVRGQST